MTEYNNTETKFIKNKYNLEEGWAIRPCFIYKEEYNDCKSIKARFQQYFVHGETSDCEQWNKDYLTCLKFEESKGNDVQLGKELIQSEQERRKIRLEAHFANDIWEKRTSPPKDWAKPLPEWLEKKNENTYLDIKQKELIGLAPAAASADDNKSYCSIM